MPPDLAVDALRMALHGPEPARTRAGRRRRTRARPPLRLRSTPASTTRRRWPTTASLPRSEVSTTRTTDELTATTSHQPHAW